MQRRHGFSEEDSIRGVQTCKKVATVHQIWIECRILTSPFNVRMGFCRWLLGETRI